MNKIVDELYKDAKPYVRWWWFSGKIEPETLRYQLDWCKKNNFGGVEIAWVYPQPNSKPGPKFLSEEWSSLVIYAKAYAKKIGLGCDFTFGTAWPFGGSFVEDKFASKTFTELSKQRLEKSWEIPYAEPGYIIDHLNHHALERYAEKMGRALEQALKISPSALFCDSWEVETEMLWTEDFEKIFFEEYGYDIRLYVRNLNYRQSARYDYRKLISKLVLSEFYTPFTRICHNLGSVARVQCHGAPTDILSAYSMVDVPESEVLLFNPNFSQIASSAAALTDKPLVSAETFTCLYGWLPYPGPGLFQGKEQTADLKLLADALFANGVNFIIWHGMPYNAQAGKNRFYATTHVGHDSHFADELSEFNKYLEKISGFMRTGKPYADIAVYLPLEDNWMKNELPEELQKPSAHYHWELHYVKLPETLKGRRPLWVTNHFLEEAEYQGKSLNIGNMKFSELYVACEWLDIAALKNLISLAKQGCPICFANKPIQPGFKKDEKYETLVRELFSQNSVSGLFQKVMDKPPLIEGEIVPEFWCRKIEDELLIFFSHPTTCSITYPMRYGQSFCKTDMNIKIALNYVDFRKELTLNFNPYQSLLLRISKQGNHKFEDIRFIPATPVFADSDFKKGSV